MLRSQNFWQTIENGGCFNHLFGTGAPFGIQIQNNFSYSGLKLIYTTTLLLYAMKTAGVNLGALPPQCETYSLIQALNSFFCKPQNDREGCKKDFNFQWTLDQVHLPTRRNRRPFPPRSWKSRARKWRKFCGRFLALHNLAWLYLKIISFATLPFPWNNPPAIPCIGNLSGNLDQRPRQVGSRCRWPAECPPWDLD